MQNQTEHMRQQVVWLLNELEETRHELMNAKKQNAALYATITEKYTMKSQRITLLKNIFLEFSKNGFTILMFLALRSDQLLMIYFFNLIF